MASSIPIPGLKHEFPDLDRRMAYELSRSKSGCNGCGASDIIKKYAMLANERRVNLQGKTLER